MLSFLLPSMSTRLGAMLRAACLASAVAAAAAGAADVVAERFAGSDVAVGPTAANATDAAAAPDVGTADAGWPVLASGTIVLIRHTNAPGFGDPPDFVPGRCAT